MRARILLTNGRRTTDLLWLSHDGSDVYWGPTGSDWKRSYHASGQLHTKSGGQKSDVVQHVPLRELKGTFHLLTIGLQNGRTWIDSAKSAPRYTGKKSDAVLSVDSRSVPPGIQLDLMVGLIEPGNSDALARLTTLRVDAEDFTLGLQQITIATSVEPWVYLAAFWSKSVWGSAADPAG